MIYIDVGACPVKEETYKVANRFSLDVCVVANSWMRLSISIFKSFTISMEITDAIIKKESSLDEIRSLGLQVQAVPMHYDGQSPSVCM